MDKTNGTEQKIPDGTKTPMWRINQLARYHKIKPVYKLEKEESGKLKKVTMSLTLDKQVFFGSANTRKQAQQNAANNALKNTSLPSPVVKKKKTNVNPNALTATVKLNGWAMAHRKEVRYYVVEKKCQPRMLPFNEQQQQLLAQPIIFQSNMDMSRDIYGTNVYPNTCFSLMHDFNHDQRHRYFYDRPQYFNVCVCVGDAKFYGQGSSQQAARHKAAENALASLSLSAERTDEANADGDAVKSDSGKSSICLLQQEAFPRNMSIVFNELDESGPAHLRRYTVEVMVGHFSGQALDEKLPHFRGTGSGMSKKEAKQAACSKVLEEIKKLPPCIKKQSKSEKPLVKSHQISPVLHPVSRLLQICQAQKIKEPTYTVDESAEKRGETKFLVHCSLQDKSVTGSGKSKKDAKKSAANAMLIELGKQPNTLKPIPNKDMTPQKSIIKVQDNSKESKRLQVKFNDLATKS